MQVLILQTLKLFLDIFSWISKVNETRKFFTHFIGQLLEDKKVPLALQKIQICIEGKHLASGVEIPFLNGGTPWIPSRSTINDFARKWKSPVFSAILSQCYYQKLKENSQAFLKETLPVWVLQPSSFNFNTHSLLVDLVSTAHHIENKVKFQEISLAQLAENPHSLKVFEEVPFFKKLKQANVLNDVFLIPYFSSSDLSPQSVMGRASGLGDPNLSKQVIKEVIFSVGSDFILVISNDTPLISVTNLAQVLQIPSYEISLAQAPLISQNSGYNFVSIPAFAEQPKKVLVNKRVLEQQVVYTSVGVSGYLLKINPQILVNNLSSPEIANV